MNKQILFTEFQVKKSIWKQADNLNQWAYSRDVTSLTVIGILSGAFMYTADFARCIGVPHKVDFMKITSYNGRFAGNPRFTLWPKFNHGEHIVILDDILDRGETIRHAVEYIKSMKPESITVMTMLHKLGANDAMSDFFNSNHIFADLGLPVEEWVYGYGLDNQDYDRSLKYISRL